MNSSTHRALVFQGGGSLGAYEAGAYKDINEELSRDLKAVGWSLHRRGSRYSVNLAPSRNGIFFPEGLIALAERNCAGKKRIRQATTMQLVRSSIREL